MRGLLILFIALAPGAAAQVDCDRLATLTEPLATNPAYFGVESVVPLDSARVAENAVVYEPCEAVHFTLAGYTDWDETDPGALALRRVAGVAELFIALGVAAERITVRPVGRDCRLQDPAERPSGSRVVRVYASFEGAEEPECLGSRRRAGRTPR